MNKRGLVSEKLVTWLEELRGGKGMSESFLSSAVSNDRLST